MKHRERHTAPSHAVGCALLVGLLAVGACGTEASEGNEEPLTKLAFVLGLAKCAAPSVRRI